MRSSDLLGDRLTDALRVRLQPVHPEEVTVRLLPAWARPFLSRWVAAVTLPWGVYVRGDILADRTGKLPALLVHELVHVRQWRTLGPFGFLRRYLGDYLGGRLRRLGHKEAYMRIRLEQEAVRIAGS
ncbi:MAG: hypothetical protein ACLFWM_06930 [Actinomycetota bacterium]